MMMDSKEHGSDRVGPKIRPEQAMFPSRLILQISAIITVALIIAIVGWALVISKLQSNTSPMQTESVEPFGSVAAQTEAQTNQLHVIQMTLAQIQAGQQEAIALQKAQAALQQQSNALQNAQFAAQVESNHARAQSLTEGQKHE